MILNKGQKGSLLIRLVTVVYFFLDSRVPKKAGTYLCDYFGALHFEFPHFAWDKGQFFVSETAAQLNFIEIAEANKVMPKASDEGRVSART